MWTFLNYKRSWSNKKSTHRVWFGSLLYLPYLCVCVHILSCPWFRVHTWVWLCKLLHPWVALQSSFLAQVFLTQSEALFLLVSNMCWLMQNSKCGSHGILSHRINVPYKLMPCPSTGPKMFWASPSFFIQAKNWIAFSATPNIFLPALKLNLLNENHLYCIAKKVWDRQNT